ncbi:alpha-hydroxy acid oxidase [Teichococcus vastitatis]|uniref:Alpha-hydroxy-acid oxidizing protein n=1 Tax=Teichococcus vastitatis TaxID=2307076 RepID=A0ABS9W9W8_9PROT|nr:alpha-hydroxy acid oxidase [Pseudoroseomonas vastitatis]MCI0756097.1 alpha-hydroxy-acid oxidizing protein [Pseudoroseomonas vastitatis]
MRRIFALEDLEGAARHLLPPPMFGYVAGAAETNASLADNRRVFDEIQFLPRMLVGVAGRSLDCEVMGQHHAMPFGIAPMGVSALTGYRGDLSLARAAARAGIPMIISAASLIRLEEIAAAAPGVWYQAYLSGDQAEALSMVDRVAQAGIETFVITADSAVVPSRENNLRTGYRTPIRPNMALLWNGLTHPAWSIGTFLRTYLRHGNPHFENAGPGRGAPLLSRQAVRDFSGRESLDWDVVHAVRARWRGRLVIKGLLHPADVALARKAGADGVILSNHGGRQLDGAVSPMRTLPAALRQAGSMAIMIDSGFRRGTDILKALGLGASFVFVGRPFNYASALAGEAGVDHAIGLLRAQLMADLGMLGLLNLRVVNREVLFLDGFRALPAP